MRYVSVRVEPVCRYPSRSTRSPRSKKPPVMYFTGGFFVSIVMYIYVYVSHTGYIMRRLYESEICRAHLRCVVKKISYFRVLVNPPCVVCIVCVWG